MSRWIIFIATFLCVYGSLHLYLLVKVRRAFYLESWSYFLIVVVLLFLMLSPIQARVLAGQMHMIPSLIMMWIAYLWMGALFIWLWLALVLDMYHLAIIMFQRLFCADWIHLMLSRRQSLTLTVLITLGLMIYGGYVAQKIQMDRVVLHSDKFNPAGNSIRVVQISDLHLGEVIIPGWLDRIVQAIQQAEPDIIVCTGDLLDGHLYDRNGIVQKFQVLKPRLGKFAVTGNHEAYAGLSYAEEFIKQAGFTLLRGSSVQVADNFFISGVDDPAVNESKSIDEATVLGPLPKTAFHLFLKHQPRLAAGSAGLFDLQLSGHTHKGQIFPFGLIVKKVYPFFSGMYPIDHGSRIYVNRGTGTWGPPFRLGALPEITIIDLLPVAAAPAEPAPAEAEAEAEKSTAKPPSEQKR